MEFLNPAFLYGFSALAIPVLIHLFNLRRYRKEYFTNVRFLSQIQLETKKRSKLKQLLILATRLLAMSCLVLVFSQPYIPSALQNGSKSSHKAISIYVDNSYSMEAIGTQGRLLDIAKKRASEVVNAYKSSDVFQLITNDFEGKHAQFVSREEFLGMLREVKITHASVELKEVISRQNDLFSRQKEGSHTSYLISDFQKSTARFENLHQDSSAFYILAPVEASRQNNLYIDSIWFTSPVHRPGQTVKLIVRIRNCGKDKLEKIPLRLVLNNIQKSVTSFDIDPSQSVEIALPYQEEKNGFQLGSLELSDYPITYDDIFYFTYTITEDIHVLSIYGRSPNLYLKTLYSSDSIFNYRTYQANQVDYRSLNEQNLILISGLDDLASGLANELKSFLERGGSVFIFPPESSKYQTYNTFFSSIGGCSFGVPDTVKQRISSLDLENEIFTDVFDKDATGRIRIPENVDLPLVLKYYPMSKGSSNPATVLMRLQNGLPFLTSESIAKGKLYVCASPPDPSFTNFQQHLLFVPVMFRMAFISEFQWALYNIAGRNTPVEMPSDSTSGKNMVKIRKWNTSYEFIPELKISGQHMQTRIQGQISEAGWYQVFAGSKEITALAFNYDRKESDINCFSTKELEANIRKYNLKNFKVLKPSGLPFSKQIEQLNTGLPLWKYFVVLALIFLAFEILLIRIFRS
ncbi:MAG: BatA domain-containing protein [Bacteroidetes bacterium]|nr:BatA domain-containing protein [Bacteroidota bacterium]